MELVDAPDSVDVSVPSSVRAGGPSAPLEVSFYRHVKRRHPLTGEDFVDSDKMRDVKWSATVSGGFATVSKEGFVTCNLPGEGLVTVQVGSLAFSKASWSLTCGQAIALELLSFWELCQTPSDWESLNGLSREKRARELDASVRGKQVRF
jgi:hypothetical protein